MPKTARLGGARLTAAAVAIAASVSVAGCGSAQPGAAAVVGDRRVTTEQVTAASAGIRQGNPQLAQGQGLERTVLFYLVIAPFVLDAARSSGAGVSPDEARAQLPKTRDPDPGAVRVLQTFLALQKLQASGGTKALTAVQDAVKAARPQISPRFGRFDYTQMAVVNATPNWLVPTANPTPSGTTTP